MKNNLGMIGVIIMALLMFAVVGLFSARLGSTTPIEPNPNPTVPENDPCWYVEYCPEE
jgi:hypothetical protein